MLRKGHGDLYKAPTKKTEESERLRGERDQITFIDLRFERWQVAKIEESKDVYEDARFRIKIVFE